MDIMANSLAMVSNCHTMAKLLATASMAELSSMISLSILTWWDSVVLS